MNRIRTGSAIVLIASSMALVAMFAGCSAPSSGGTTNGTTGGASGGSKVTVVEKGFKFNPAAITAAVGDSVVFENQDSAPHDVVVGTVDLGTQSPGQSVTWKADKSGTFPVKCLIHPTMVGQVTVGSGGSSGVPPAGGTNGGSPAPPAGGSGY